MKFWASGTGGVCETCDDESDNHAGEQRKQHEDDAGHADFPDQKPQSHDAGILTQHNEKEDNQDSYYDSLGRHWSATEIR